MKTITLSLSVVISLAACTGERATTPDQPYAGLHEREIPALSEQRVADLLAGRGLGYALTAELNHYPGPMHVLVLAEELELSSDQREQVEGIQAAMHERGRSLGRLLVDLERKLDLAFEEGSIDASRLERLTGEIGAVDARLRAAHLLAHVRTRALLTPQQVHSYDELRGYSSPRHGHGETHHVP